jgi:hypothetical protein
VDAARMKDLIALSIQRGTTMYNAGDFGGCAELYYNPIISGRLMIYLQVSSHG